MLFPRLDAPVLSRAQILSQKRCHRDAERLGGQDHEAVEPLRDADPGDRIRAEPVHVAHDKNVRKTDQRALHARGHADAQNLADHAAALPVHLAQVETATLDLAADRAVGHRHRHGLREHRGDADTRDPHIKRTDKQQVQRNIHSAGHDQNAERDIRPPKCAQDARGVVIDNGEHQSGKIDAQIGQRRCPVALLRAGKVQKLRREQDAEQRQQHAEHHAERKRHADRVAEPFPLPAAVRLRHDDVRADGHGVEEIDDQIGDHAAHRHSGEGILVHQIPGDQGVHAVVKVLQQLAQNERD